MTAVDTNILVYAHRLESPWHDSAAATLRELAEGISPWAIPWPCVHEFVAVVTNARIFRTPTPLRRALDDVDVWLESPSLRMLGEPDLYWSHFREVATRGAVSGAMVHDGRVAAICRAHGVSELLTADRDFSRFGSLKVRNPLAV